MATSAAEYEASTWKTTASVAQRSTWTVEAPRAGVEGVAVNLIPREATRSLGIVASAAVNAGTKRHTL
ncbi:hypothetical protein GUJ93_ZPchr0013g35058 [Zizania palustris]|uniref:Uncharacterized protein n=1 Tax=Zizania palustris TaxID=103762 RepID=A0A8J6BYT2_ZIZPA|nr:hypothetical protein GUJ93_ZPchr0013g35058 [Zizania palustris]